MDVGNDFFQRHFQAFTGKVSNLRLECADIGSRGINDGLAERPDGILFVFKMVRNSAEVWIKSDAKHGIDGLNAVIELGSKHKGLSTNKRSKKKDGRQLPAQRSEKRHTRAF